MKNSKTIILTDKNYGGYTTIHNPVNSFWDIELLLTINKIEEYNFVVKFTSKHPILFPSGEEIVQSKMIKEVDFEDKEKFIRKELRNIGMMNDIIFRGIKEYVEYLKLNRIYTFYEVIEGEIAEDGNLQNQVQNFSKEYYELFVEKISLNLELF